MQVRVREYDDADHDELLRLAERLTIGGAPWRDSPQVLAAVRNWVEGSIDTRGDNDGVVLVARVSRASGWGSSV